jgi:S-DNA-T family DNA segregation ATPase FtsK/SpoIIIE
MNTKSLAYQGDSRFFSRRRLQPLYGVFWWGLAIFLAVAAITFQASDPSLNYAGEYPVSNKGGYIGALLADFVLQTIGFSTLILFFTLIAWGWRCFTQEKPRYFWMRLSCLLVALIASALLFSYIPSPANWPVTSGMGGAVGALINHHLGHYFAGFILILCGSAAFLMTWPLSLGLTRYEWKNILGGAGKLAFVSFFILGGIFRHRVKVNFDGYSLPSPRKWWEKFRSAEVEEQEEEIAPASKRKRAPKLTVMERKETTIGKHDPATDSPLKGKQEAFKLQYAGEYQLPDLDFLTIPKKNKKAAVSEASLQQNARLLESVLHDFGVKGEIIDIHPGPVVTLYELEPSAGTKSSRVIGLADDIARSMSATSARIAVIPGRNALGIELPNAKRETVYLRELLEDESFSASECKLPLALGKNIGGVPQVVDLAKMPHLLVAGTTGSGKSVSVNAMIASLLYHLTPDECKFIMIDPKMLELSVYDGIPHLLAPVVTEPAKAVVALKWVTKEMENRYRLMANFGVRNIEGYNKRIKDAATKGEQLKRTVQTGFDPETGKPIYEDQPLDMNALPFIVVVVDEMADLMLCAGKDIETSIQRLAQMARAAGIHIIMATQRPSVDVITGVIKANFPTRISFQVTSRIDSRTILGEQGAEQLLGQGDMLYMAGGGRISRVHAPFVSDAEIDAIVSFLKTQGAPNYVEDVTIDPEELEDFGDGDESDGDRALYNKAVAIVKRDGKASTSYVQRCLKLGYNRAARIIEQMEREGIITPPNHAGKREIIG